MAKGFTKEDDDLLAELGVEDVVEKQSSYTPRQERIIAGFEEIQRFVEEHGRVPQHGEGRDIFERLYAVRLDRILASKECLEVLGPFDPEGLLQRARTSDGSAPDEDLSDDELLDALGVKEGETGGEGELTKLTHVRSRREINVSEEIARRVSCADFDRFRPIFEQVQRDLDSGARRTAKYKDDGEVRKDDLFVVEGQKALIADLDEEFVTDYERKNRRLRVIFDNGTEARMLLRSFQRALYRDGNGRRILAADTEVAPLFAGELDADDAESGRIYVLRSLSDHPFIAANRGVIHKIGVTRGDVGQRIANAKKDPTYLLADVEVVDTYQLANVNRQRLEQVLHQFFADARLDLELADRFGGKVQPREWFLVPLSVIEETIDLIKIGTIGDWMYEPKEGRLIQRKNSAR